MSENIAKVVQISNKVFKNSSEVAILPPNLLIQGIIAFPGITTGAPSKIRGGPSLGREKYFKKAIWKKKL